MDLATYEAETAFADLTCADPEWLRDEFDALVSASFGQPPAPPPGRTAPVSPGRRRPASELPAAARTHPGCRHLRARSIARVIAAEGC
jgi:hypothetical protein